MFLLPSAEAADIVVDVGADRAMGVGGNWARAFANGDGTWDFTWAAGGDYNVLPMGADLTVVDRDRVTLTGRDNLVDHAIVRCDDGTFLHAASGNVDTFDDSAWAFRYDADWGRIAEATLEERVGTRGHNDLPVLCSPVGDATAFLEASAHAPVLFWLGDDAAKTSEVTLADAPALTGGSLAWDPDTDLLVVVGTAQDGTVWIDTYDDALTRVDRVEVDLSTGDERVYWPQATLRAGEHWLVAHMARDDGAGFSADEGNVWLAVFDLDWNLVQHVQVTDFSPPTGAMRPGLARDGDTLLVLYDVSVTPHLTPLTLDGGALGEDPVVADEDEGIPPTRACGCGDGSAALLLLAVRRRWRSS
jgi:hypothetical protein